MKQYMCIRGQVSFREIGTHVPGITPPPTEGESPFSVLSVRANNAGHYDHCKLSYICSGTKPPL